MSVDKEKLEAIKAKLRKLIAKEESARTIGNLAEAESFAAKIQELMMDYELEVDQVMGENRVHSIGEELFDCDSLTNRHESNWVVHLYCACAASCFCKAALAKGYNEYSYPIMIWGDANNRELLHYMVAQLTFKVRVLARNSFKEYEGPDKRNTYIRSFLKGACKGIGDRLREDRLRDQQANAGVHGLVLSKMAAVMNFMADKGVRLKQGKRKLGSSMSGFASGVAAGRKVSINKGIDGNKGYGGQKLLG